MRSFDFTPLYRASIGFDQIADLMDRVLETETASPSSYPPYNIEKLADDKYRISIAVAGFAQDELTVEQRENALVVAAKKAQEDNKAYLHRGIATRAFERRFHLADHVRVVGASHADGMLHINLEREIPEALKPRQIDIVTNKPTEVIEAKAVN